MAAFQRAQSPRASSSACIPDSCPQTSLSLRALQLREFSDADFSRTFFGARLRNLSCHDLSFGGFSAHLRPGSSAVTLGEPTSVSCTMQFHLANYNGILSVVVDVAPSSAEVSSMCGKDNACIATTASVSRCTFAAKVRRLLLDPPNSLLDYLLQRMRVYAEHEAEKYVCGVLAPQYADLLLNKTLSHAEDPPPLVDGALRMDEWPLFRALDIGSFTSQGQFTRAAIWVDNCNPALSTLRLHVSWTSDKAVRLAVSVNNATPATEPQSERLPSALLPQTTQRSWTAVVDAIVGLISDRVTELSAAIETTLLSGTVSEMSGTIDGLHHSELSVDVTLSDLRCDDATTRLYRCHVPRQGGVTFSNLRLARTPEYMQADISQVLTNVLGPQLLVPAMNRAINAVLGHPAWGTGTPEAETHNGTAVSARDRFYLPMLPPVATHTAPPGWTVLVFVTLASALSAALLALSAWRQKAQPAYYWTTDARDASEPAELGDDHAATLVAGEVAADASAALLSRRTPISTWAVLLEDAALIVAVLVCTGLFASSNCMTGATVSLGSEVPLYSFSLMNTVRDLWGAGLWFLSVAVFLFSCVYPYLKLASILVYTIVLQRPDAVVLRAIDYLGKFSFLDTFVMIIMVSGMQVDRLVVVRAQPSFYMFFAATIGSILVGNYATACWRNGTTLRPRRSLKRRDEDADGLESGEQAALLRQEATTVVSAESPRAERGWLNRALKNLSKALTSVHWLVSIPSALLVLLCSLPAWSRGGCLCFTLGGLAPLVTATPRSLGMEQLLLNSGLHRLCQVVIVAVLFWAPLLYTLFYPRMTVLASWGAADVFLLACVASALQLNQFVQFVLGPSLDGVFTAHARLNPGLLLLAGAAVVPWGFTVATMMRVDLRSKAMGCLRRAHSLWLPGPTLPVEEALQPDSQAALTLASSLPALPGTTS